MSHSEAEIVDLLEHGSVAQLQGVLVMNAVDIEEIGADMRRAERAIRSARAARQEIGSDVRHAYSLLVEEMRQALALKTRLRRALYRRTPEGRVQRRLDF